MAAAPGPLSGSAAEGKPVATNAPELGVKTNPLPGNLEMPGGLDAAGQQAAGALKLQFGTTLQGDAETLLNTQEGNYKYQRELTGKEYLHNAQERGRAINEGVAQSGMAAGGHARSVAEFLGKRQGFQLRSQENINRTERAAQEQSNKAKQGLANIISGSAQREELKKRKNPETSPETPAQAAANTPGMGGVQGYPKATAYVNAAFPGGIAEQRAYIKQKAAEEAAKRKR